MQLDFMFFLVSVSLGVGLAMDAFSVSMANGLNEPKMKRGKMLGIAGVFAGFQGLMPLIGWFCVHTLLQYFRVFQPFIPWIALILLAFVGGKMLFDGMHGECEEGAECEAQKLRLGILLVQGIATSIDALSVGFTIAEYNVFMAISAAIIIAIVTLFICLVGLVIGKKFGTKLSNKAQIFGGVILILIGIEIFVSGVL